jgi:hypothetical protein
VEPGLLGSGQTNGNVNWRLTLLFVHPFIHFFHFLCDFKWARSIEINIGYHTKAAHIIFFLYR